MKYNARRGSALLIVLGMVAFMVISSVAFSFYMRVSRQPSSYLRTAVTGRYLLKSALANAIARLDGAIDYEGRLEGVYDDYYPGLSPTAGAGDPRLRGDEWAERVFTPFGETSDEETVATLTLEGLAYLPPAFINEVRVRSRRTKTAIWQNLSYEAGRYAFCAVDVSDCFDINKVRAGARTSAANQRIGFSSMFLNGTSGSSLDTTSMSTFNTKVNTVTESGQIPFVSLADFNLYFGPGKFSPFCNYIGQAGDSAILRESDTVACNALYITDTWFPPTNTLASAVRFNLSGTDQPFDEYDPNGKFSVEEVLRAAGRTRFGQKVRDRLGGVGTVCLYDYLDADNIPTSFALPTVETAPMVCALGMQAGGGGLKPTIAAGSDVRKATISLPMQKKEIVVTATPYEFDWGVERLHVIGLAAFPFKRLRDKNDYATSFKVEALVRVFLAPSDIRAHLNADSPVVPRATGDWADGYANGIITRKVSMVSGNLSYANDLPSQRDTVKSFEGDVSVETDATVVFWEVSKQVFTIDPDTGARTPAGDPEVYYSMDGTASAAKQIEFHDRTGVKETWLGKLREGANPEMFQNNATLAENALPKKVAEKGQDIHAGSYVPHVAVWVKVENAGGHDSGRVVDYVPASAPDDVTWGQHNPSENDEVLTACGDARPPILRFSGTTAFTYGISAVEKLQAGSGDFGWSVLYTVDPRFNYAPEAWYAPSGVEPSSLENSDGWLQSLSGVLGTNGRDPDIFMFTSDQEYLQAMGELQFLPLTRDLTVNPGQIIEDYAKWRDGYQFDGSVQTVLNFMPGMWQTYSSLDGDPIYTLGDRTIEIESASGDFRVNPFTTDERIFRAAIANTPYDYYVSSTNKNLNLLGDCDYRTGKPTLTEAMKHAFNSQTACARWTDEVGTTAESELEQICRALRDGIRRQAYTWSGGISARRGWEHFYDNLDWYDGKTGDDQKSFLGVDLDTPLHAVDRKFLHSFWRECFQNRQQLFLVFIRAEPLTVGGSGRAALANSQQGARGVALVWRDPEPPAYQRESRPNRGSVTTNTRIAPHRTRILFYHQFD